MLNLFKMMFVLALVLVTGFRSDQPPSEGSSKKERPLSSGLWEEGFCIGTVRTDCESLDEGTAANRLTLVPCLYPKWDDELLGPAGASAVGTSPCAMGPDRFTESNPYTNAGGWPGTNFWVLSVNNEFAYDNELNTGPPNQSLPVYKPGEGLMGLQVSPIEGCAQLWEPSDPVWETGSVVMDPRFESVTNEIPMIEDRKFVTLKVEED